MGGAVTSKTAEQCGLGFQRCVEFDALGEYIDAGNNSILNMGTNGFTITFWMKHSGVTNAVHDTVIGKKGAGWIDSGWLFRTPNSSSLIFHLANQSSYAEKAISIKPNEWYHIVGVRNGSTIFLYRNGKLEQQDTSSIYADNMDSSASLKIGFLPGWNHFFGQVDEVAIYNQALAAYQIQQLYAQGVIKQALAIR